MTTSERVKERQTYREDYRNPWVTLRPAVLRKVRMPYLTQNAKIADFRIRGQGIVMRGDRRLEYQDIRVYTEVDE